MHTCSCSSYISCSWGALKCPVLGASDCHLLKTSIVLSFSVFGILLIYSSILANLSTVLYIHVHTLLLKLCFPYHRHYSPLALLPTIPRDIPLLEATLRRSAKNTPSFQREVDSLRGCLDAIFHNKFLEARKYIPSVTQSLKSGKVSVSLTLVPELVHRLMEFKVRVCTVYGE